MKKSFYIILIFAVNVFFIGMIVIQSIYIKNMVEMRHLIFSGKINDVMAEALQLIDEDNDFNKKKCYFNDSINNLYFKDLFESKPGYFLYRPANKELRIKHMKLFNKQENMPTDIILAGTGTNHDTSENLIQDSSILFFETEPQFTEQDIYFMDSVVKTVLEAFGLHLDFEFGIYCPYFNRYVLLTNEEVQQEITESDYIYNFKVNNSFVAFPAYFAIYFPLQEQYLSLNSTPLTVTSISMIVIIYLLFLYTIISTIQYKKVLKLRDDFVDNMTHEFKTPIATISLASEALGDKDILASADIRENYVKIISIENNRLERMVETILSNATVNKRMRSKLNKEVVDINMLVEEVINMFSVLLDKKHGQIICLKAKDPLIQLDKEKILIAIKNILDNAIKYTKGKPFIHIEITNKKNKLLIEISDNGIGIERKYHSKIFDRLFRISTGNVHDVRGYGLGLNYVKEIVRSHGGKIKVESKKNKGSTFKIYLPVKL
ncbi:MAG: HAMP domain-containing histidine kinase [Paludibacteraceae bacterium]|nr:HAMP domain-containing histidine kinase [Paludibacteraceae bacterium]